MQVQLLCSLAGSGNFEELNNKATPENCGLARADGLTPLMCSARAEGRPQSSHATCAALLLSHANDKDHRMHMANATDRNGYCSLHFAADVDNVGVMEKLLLAGANVNKVDNMGRSPLAVAVMRNSKTTADLLLKAGADPEQRDHQGWSPLMLAREAGKDNGSRMARRLERWLPTLQIPDDFRVIERHKRSQNSETGRFADLYDVKTEPPDLGIVLRVLTRFDDNVISNELRGLNALKMVRHVNIVQLIKVTEVENGATEMFLEDIDGSTLESVMNSKKRPFIEVRVRKYFRQVVSALSYLHNHLNGPIIHRDINCRNIMLARDGVVKLIDFGLSLPSGSVCASSSLIAGNMAFCAPEIIGEDSPNYSRKSDIWAAGCVLYAMTMGADPYRASNPAATVMKILGPVPQIDTQKFSVGLRDLYERCMLREPSERISAVGMSLHEFLNWNTVRDNDQVLKDEVLHWTQNGHSALEALNELVRNINESYKKAIKAKVGTTAAAVAGGITAIVGFALLIPSFGAALPLAIAGTSVAIAGGVGNATADIAGTVVQRKEFKKSMEKINEFKQLTQNLMVASLENIANSVDVHVGENSSSIDLSDSKVLLEFLRDEIVMVRSKLEASGMNHKGNMPEEQIKQVNEMFERWLCPVEDSLNQLSDVDSLMRTRIVNREASNQFNGALQSAVDFVLSILRILMFGSKEEPTELYLEQVKGGLRSAAGGAQLGAEIGSAAGRTVLGRVFGIVGSAVFTAVDIGLLAYYSVRLHRATKEGANTEKADLVACHIDIFKSLLREAEDLELP